MALCVEIAAWSDLPEQRKIDGIFLRGVRVFFLKARYAYSLGLVKTLGTKWVNNLLYFNGRNPIHLHGTNCEAVFW